MRSSSSIETGGRSKQTESELTRAIRKVLDGLGVYSWKQWQGPMSQPRGVADIIGLRRVKVADLVKQGVEVVGVFTAIEVKRPDGRVSPDQERFLDRVRAHGGVAMVARSVDDVINGLGLRDRFLF